MNVLCVDPGPWETGWAAINTKNGLKGAPGGSGIDRNEDFANFLKLSPSLQAVVCEMPQAYKTVGQDVINTAFWAGEYRRICKDRGIPFHEITRNEVRHIMCGVTSGVNDKHVNEAVAYHYGVETRKGQWTGFLKGITSHSKAALAAGVAWMKHTGVK